MSCVFSAKLQQADRAGIKMGLEIEVGSFDQAVGS